MLAAQETGDGAGQGLGRVEDVVVAPEPVELPEETDPDRFDARLGELGHEPFRLVAERVVLRADDERRRELVEPVVTFVEADSRMGLQKVAPGRVDFAFLDGAHTYHDVIKEFEQIVPRQKTGDTIMFDDYSPTIFPGLVKAVDDGCARWGYDKAVIRSRGDRAYVIARKQ